jgi:vancomycin resistance protein YoaR
LALHAVELRLYNELMTTRPYTTSGRTFTSIEVLFALLGGLLLFLGLVLLWVLGHQLVYAGRIFPGVSVAGVDLSGMSPADGALELSETLSYPIKGKVLFRQGNKAWVVSPFELGMVFDASASARAAYDFGRKGHPFTALADQIQAHRSGSPIAPVLIFDERVAYQYLQGLAQQVDQPMIEATLQIDGANVTAVPGQAGRLVNMDATLANLNSQLRTFRDGEVLLATREAQPSITDLSAQAEEASQILRQSLQLAIPNAQAGDPGPWLYQPEVLANLIQIQKVEDGNTGKGQLSLNPDTLRQMLTAIESQVYRQAANARFHFDASTGQLVVLAPSATGRNLDINASIQVIADALLRGEHSVPLVVTETQPAVADTATAEQLGISGLLPNGVQTSYFYGSHAERVQNITIAAARFDGVLVAPGETFSMVNTLGDVSLDNGYAEAPIIFGGRTIQGVGGGVCQVSTTLFRAVFFAGFPVVQRVPHAYRVSYYEQTISGRDPSLAGLDATVYVPLVDFQFTNDSPYWLLMETSVSGYSLTWKLYSTYDGRTVQWQTTGPQNIIPAPDPLFKENQDLNPGQMIQTDYAANGADVTVDRTVLKDGAVYFDDQYKTRYESWQAVCEYAPGISNPEKVAMSQSLCQPPGK